MFQIQLWSFVIALCGVCTLGVSATDSATSERVCQADGKAKVGSLLLSQRQDILRGIAVPKEDVLVRQKLEADISASRQKLEADIRKEYYEEIEAEEKKLQAAHPNTDSVSGHHAAPCDIRQFRCWLASNIKKLRSSIPSLHALKVTATEQLHKSWPVVKTKAADPLCQLWCFALLVVCAATWVAVKSSNRTRRWKTRQKQLRDDSLGYLFKARWLERAGLEEQAR